MVSGYRWRQTSQTKASRHFAEGAERALLGRRPPAAGKKERKKEIYTGIKKERKKYIPVRKKERTGKKERKKYIPVKKE